MVTNIEIFEQLSLAIAYVLQQATDLSDAQALQVAGIYPEWHVDVHYKAGQRARKDSKLWVCAKNHTSSDSTVPGTDDNYWTEVTVDASTGYEVWVEPQNASNAYNYGDVVWYPDVNTTLYRSLKNNNKKPPTDSKSWEVASVDATE